MFGIGPSIGRHSHSDGPPLLIFEVTRIGVSMVRPMHEILFMTMNST